MKSIPCIRMVRILRLYAVAKGLPFDIRSWESIKRTLNHYNIHVSKLN